MLGTIRERIQGIFAVVVISMLIIPFAMWGVDSYFTREKNPPVATVNGKDIDKTAFERLYREEVNRYQGKVDPKLLSSGVLRDRTLSLMINQMVFTQYASDAGYVISETQLDNLIRSRPEFQVQGKYSESRFNGVLRSAGMTVAAYKHDLRSVKIQDQMSSAFRFSAIVPQSEVDALVALKEQQRKVAYLVLPPSAFGKEVQVGQDEIKKYYEANKNQFNTPDLVRIEYAELSLGDLMAKQKISEKEARDEYNQNIDQYTTPARRRVSHILIPLDDDATAAQEKAAREKLSEIEKDLKNGMSFADAAKKFSQDPTTKNKGGDLGYVKPGELPSRDLDFALNDLKPGEVSKPVRSKFGFHILKITDFTPAKVEPFAKVKDKIIDRLKRRRAETAFDDLRERFESLVYEHPDSLKPAADDIGVKIHTSEWFTRAGGTGLMANPQIVRTAFSQPVRQLKQNSDLIEVKRNTLVSIRIKNDKPAAPRPLEQVSAQIKGYLLQQKISEKAGQVGQSLLAQAQAGKSLQTLGQAYKGSQWHSPMWITRSDLDTGKGLKVNKQVAEAAFGAAKPQNNKPVYGGVDLGPGGYAVYAVENVKNGDLKSAPRDVVSNTETLLTQQWGSGFYQDQLISMRKQADVEIHKSQLKSTQQ